MTGVTEQPRRRIFCFSSGPFVPMGWTRGRGALGADRGADTSMDNHERGIERKFGRPDTPLPDWDGSFGGDPKRLPRVVQKLMAKRRLTPEEKAEMLWRLYELDQADRVRTNQRVGALLLLMLMLTGVAIWLYLHPQPWIAERLLAIVDPTYEPR